MAQSKIANLGEDLSCTNQNLGTFISHNFSVTKIKNLSNKKRKGRPNKSDGPSGLLKPNQVETQP